MEMPVGRVRRGSAWSSTTDMPRPPANATTNQDQFERKGCHTMPGQGRYILGVSGAAGSRQQLRHRCDALLP